MTRPQPQRAGRERAQFAVEQKLIKLVGYAPTTGRLWWKAKPSRNTLIGRTIGRKCNKMRPLLDAIDALNAPGKGRK